MSDLELRLEPKQALRISPQLLQATRMLLMPAQELSHFLERAAEENPLLERIEHRTNARGSSEPVTFVPEAGRWDSAMHPFPPVSPGSWSTDGWTTLPPPCAATWWSCWMTTAIWTARTWRLYSIWASTQR